MILFYLVQLADLREETTEGLTSVFPIMNAPRPIVSPFDHSSSLGRVETKITKYFV